ncbi:hypothetical protein V8F20_006468 [Naviculisporaceae sp. PSN 640]
MEQDTSIDYVLTVTTPMGPEVAGSLWLQLSFLHRHIRAPAGGPEEGPPSGMRVIGRQAFRGLRRLQCPHHTNASGFLVFSTISFPQAVVKITQHPIKKAKASTATLFFLVDTYFLVGLSFRLQFVTAICKALCKVLLRTAYRSIPWASISLPDPIQKQRGPPGSSFCGTAVNMYLPIDLQSVAPCIARTWERHVTLRWTCCDPQVGYVARFQSLRFLYSNNPTPVTTRTKILSSDIFLSAI